MDSSLQQKNIRRALELGRGTDPTALHELIPLLKFPASEVRRLAASAMGKLASFGADATSAVEALVPLALRDPHPQVQQYALKALKVYGTAARRYLHDLEDLAANPVAKDYVRKAASSTAEAIRKTRSAENASVHQTCVRCNKEISGAEFLQSQKAFQRAFCDHCFDEVYLERRNFDNKIELNKTIIAKAGTLVQSDGERRIADWLTQQGIAFRYDERFRILDGYAIRPDFYLPEFDVYVEYWGMDTADYKIGMLKKQQLYQQEGKKLISIYPPDKSRIGEVLSAKLRFFGFVSPSDDGHDTQRNL